MTIKKKFYRYPLPNGYVERVILGVYRITEKGQKLLEILRQHQSGFYSERKKNF